ncbi:hypothetical protein KEM56_001931 [Ascosphaera pollenicola]|nr:hypothetical protein KEM56_001931 [Ascosphaera pollenicola]
MSLIPPLRSSTNRLSHPPSLAAQISARQERIRKRATRDLSTRTSRTDFFDGDSSSDVGLSSSASKSKHFSVLEYLRQSPSPTPSTLTPRSGVMEAVAEEGESVRGVGPSVREEKKREVRA